jgi:hypothetical protein
VRGEQANLVPPDLPMAAFSAVLELMRARGCWAYATTVICQGPVLLEHDNAIVLRYTPSSPVPPEFQLWLQPACQPPVGERLKGREVVES